MKKLRTTFLTAGILAIAALAMVSCSKEESAQAGGPDRTGTISVSVSGLMGEYTQNEDTKAGLVSNVRVSWKADDKVYAFDGTQCLGELNVSLKDGNDYYALLTGELLEPASGTTKITLVYASGYSATQGQTVTDGKLSFDISSQSSGGDSKNTPFVAFGTLDYTEGTPNLNEKVVDFTLATSVMRLNCTGLAASAAITGAKLKGMSNNCVLNVTDAGAELVQGAIGNISLSFADGFNASASGAQVIYAGIAKNGTASAQTLEVKQSKTYEWSFGSKTREAARSINAICQLTEKIILPYVVIRAKYDGTNDTDLKWYRQNLAISPSGNKSWKGGNSSAVKVPGTGEDVINGDYFQWAAYEGYCQVEGQTVADRGLLVYNSFTSKACGDGADADAFTCKSGKTFVEASAPYYYGSAYTEYTSGEVNLKKTDDVANIILGDSWRMPTRQEFKAMYDATKWTWDSTDMGYYVTEKGVELASDKSNALLFFPAAGFSYDTSLLDAGSSGDYWSSSLYSRDPNYACYLDFWSSDVYPPGNGVRYAGFTVRPVSD